ncbi:hypothetical protein [Microbacterium lacusdiani]
MTSRSPLVRTDRTTSPQQRAGTRALRRGVRARSAEWAALSGHDRYRERVRAAALALDDPLFSFESAAVLLGLPVFGEPRYIHLFVSGAAHSYRQGDIQSHTGVDGRDEVIVDGVRVTSLIDTVIDLIRVLPLAFGVAVVDAALRMGVSVDDVRDRLLTQRNPRGAARAREALKLSDARSESVLESISRVVIHLLGFEAPELQVSFMIDGRERRPDFFWPGARIAGDADGDAKYFLGDADETRRRVRDQRRRDIELQQVADRTLHWEWPEATHPPRLERILASAGVPRIRPADPRVTTAVTNTARTLRRRDVPSPANETGHG